MTTKLKAFRAVALLAAMSGACLLVVSLGSAPAKAAEERLHSEKSFGTFGLLPPGNSHATQSGVEGGHSNGSAGQFSVSSGLSKPQNRGPKEPRIEDPGLPGYEGNGAAPSGNAAP